MAPTLILVVWRTSFNMSQFFMTAGHVICDLLDLDAESSEDGAINGNHCRCLVRPLNIASFCVTSCATSMFSNLAVLDGGRHFAL